MKTTNIKTTAELCADIEWCRERVAQMIEVLRECREYFDGRADAEYFTDSAAPIGNEEMRLLVRIDQVLP